MNKTENTVRTPQITPTMAFIATSSLTRFCWTNKTHQLGDKQSCYNHIYKANESF
eukprot:gnl/Chilomastix_caulleri/8141.p2 GENE.gnl/Chilomastix_caulleri/8141~~gnl/Chilomastix_caulleri/8141.p2  ORF type:complete len:55 (-),score=4.65 gnl/Chilomastix_caulleri/8141:202-366(-)